MEHRRSHSRLETLEKELIELRQLILISFVLIIIFVGLTGVLIANDIDSIFTILNNLSSSIR